MSLLANGGNTVNNIIVIVLCIAAVVFLLINAFLVISLHKHNSRLVGKKKFVYDEQELTEENEDNTETDDSDL